MSVLSIQNLSKNFGEYEIIKDVTFDVPEGTIYGFLGQNGAGKTTTMKMILGLLKPTKGTIYVCGQEVKYGETKTNENIGFLPDVPEFYGFMRPMEYLNLCGEVTGLEKEIIKERSAQLLSMVGLDQANKKIGGFSRGMKQRLGIAQALLNEPKLLICDEPTSALDPVGRKEILDILLSIKGKTTIMFSTHILSDVEHICDHVSVLHKGSLALNGTLTQLKQNQKEDKIQITFGGISDVDKFLKQEVGCGLFQEGSRKDHVLTLTTHNMEETKRKLFDGFSAAGIYPQKVEVMEPTLESLFMEVVK